MPRLVGGVIGHTLSARFIRATGIVGKPATRHCCVPLVRTGSLSGLTMRQRDQDEWALLKLQAFVVVRCRCLGLPVLQGSRGIAFRLVGDRIGRTRDASVRANADACRLGHGAFSQGARLFNRQGQRNVRRIGAYEHMQQCDTHCLNACRGLPCQFLKDNPSI